MHVVFVLLVCGRLLKCLNLCLNVLQLVFLKRKRLLQTRVCLVLGLFVVLDTFSHCGDLGLTLFLIVLDAFLYGTQSTLGILLITVESSLGLANPGSLVVQLGHDFEDDISEAVLVDGDGHDIVGFEKVDRL